MTERSTLQWIKTNLSAAIKAAIIGTNYREDWLAAMAMREMGFKLMQIKADQMKVADVHACTRGDYSQRPGETEKKYHGYGYWQIDIDSYPDFVRSGDWKDPAKCAAMAVKVLDEKRKALSQPFPLLSGTGLEDAITAAYNCGQGNTIKALKAGKNVDRYTHQGNYSKEVRRFRELYLSLK